MVVLDYTNRELPFSLSPSTGRVTDLRALGLNERQIEALRLMINEGKELTNGAISIEKARFMA